MNYSRSNNLKTSLINKKRNETISQRLNNQKLPGLQGNNDQKSTNRLITEFVTNNGNNNCSLDQKDSLHTTRTEPLFKLKPTMIYPPKQRMKNPIETLKIKTENMMNFMNSLENDKFRKTMEIFKLSLAGGDDNPQKANAGFKNSMNFGYVGYLLKSDYFAKQEKKDYLNNNNQYPNKKFYFFKPNSKRKAEFTSLKKKTNNFNDYLYDIDPCISISPNTLGKSIKDLTNFLKTNKDIEKQRKMLDFVSEFARNEGKEFYNQNLNWKNEELSIRKESQRDFSSSKALKQEIFDFYYSLTDYHEKDAELKNLKENLLSSFRDYDKNFRQIIEELIRNNDYLRKIENEKKNFKYERENF